MSDTKCQTCQSIRILNFSGRSKDQFCCSMKDAEDETYIIENSKFEGYTPSDIGLGNEPDYMEGDLCLHCGQLQGTWPLEISEVENHTFDY